MRVLFACTDCTPERGGISRYNHTLASTLRDLGWEVEILPLSGDLAQARTKLAALIFKLRYVIRSARHLAQTPDAPLLLGHVNLWPLALLSRFFLRRHPVILLAYGIEVWSAPSRVRAWALRGACQVWAISDFTREAYATGYGYPKTRISVLLGTHGFPDPTEGAPLPVEPYGLTVCRMDASEGYKGVDTLLWALVQLPFVRWVFVGNGSDRDRMGRMAAELGLQDRLTFRKDLSDAELANLYEGCRLFALPSAKEGLGLVFLEALSYAKPIIAGAHAGALEITPSQDGGRQVVHGDVVALVQAIRDLWPEATARREGQAGQRWAAATFGASAYQGRVAGALAQSLRAHQAKMEGAPCAES